MAVVHNFVVPHMIVDGDQEAMEQVLVADGYDATLTGDDVYVEGDLVQVTSGKVLRSQITVAANVPALFLAGADHDQPFGLTRGTQTTAVITDVHLNVIPDKNVFVMTLQDDSADGAPHVFTAADLQATRARIKREVIWNDVEKCYTVRNGTTNPTATLLGVFKGEVDDSNVQVLVRLNPLGAE